jgi:accessory gene regulator protein AgrB
VGPNLTFEWGGGVMLKNYFPLYICYGIAVLVSGMLFLLVGHYYASDWKFCIILGVIMCLCGLGIVLFTVLMRRYKNK